MNKAKIKTQQKEYRERNKNKIALWETEYRKRNKDKIAVRKRLYRENNKDKILEYKRAYWCNNKDKHKIWRENYIQKLATNVNWVKELTLVEAPLMLEDCLTVLCKQCKNRFQPTNNAVMHRIRALKGEVSGENNLYCSQSCKNSCSTYRRLKWPKGFKPHPRELQGPWAKAVKERDNYECQRCGAKENLHAHHIEALVKEYDAWHIDNGITFCVVCHYNYAHKLPGCTLAELRDGCKL